MKIPGNKNFGLVALYRDYKVKESFHSSIINAKIEAKKQHDEWNLGQKINLTFLVFDEKGKIIQKSKPKIGKKIMWTWA